MADEMQDTKRLLDRLSMLRESAFVIDELVGCGEAIIPMLRDFLLHGKPSHICQPRQNAVKVLAKSGAKAVLLEYLAMQKEIEDPVISLGEEAVENTAHTGRVANGRGI